MLRNPARKMVCGMDMPKTVREQETQKEMEVSWKPERYEEGRRKHGENMKGKHQYFGGALWICPEHFSAWDFKFVNQNFAHCHLPWKVV